MGYFIPDEPDKLILPPKKRDGYEHLISYLTERIKDKNLLDKTKNLFEEIKGMIDGNGGDIDILERVSEGGSHEYQINPDFSDYLMIKLKGIVILEAIGQIGNGIYFLVDDNKLDENLTKTREELIKDGLAYKLSHEANLQYDSYNFTGRGILDILKCLAEDSDMFIKMATPDNEYSSLSRALRNYHISELVDEYDIKPEDLEYLKKNYLVPRNEKEKGFVSKLDKYQDDNKDKTDKGTVIGDYIKQSKTDPRSPFI